MVDDANVSPRSRRLGLFGMAGAAGKIALGSGQSAVAAASAALVGGLKSSNGGDSEANAEKEAQRLLLSQSNMRLTDLLRGGPGSGGVGRANSAPAASDAGQADKGTSSPRSRKKSDATDKVSQAAAKAAVAAANASEAVALRNDSNGVWLDDTKVCRLLFVCFSGVGEGMANISHTRSICVCYTFFVTYCCC